MIPHNPSEKKCNKNISVQIWEETVKYTNTNWETISEAAVVQILTGSCTILIYAVHVTHSFAVLGTCEALVGCTPESSPGKTKNKRDGEDNSGNNFGFGNLVT